MGRETNGMGKHGCSLFFAIFRRAKKGKVVHGTNEEEKLKGKNTNAVTFRTALMCHSSIHSLSRALESPNSAAQLSGKGFIIFSSVVGDRLGSCGFLPYALRLTVVGAKTRNSLLNNSSVFAVSSS